MQCLTIIHTHMRQAYGNIDFFPYTTYKNQHFYLFIHFQCLETPLKPQYAGGIVENPELNDGLKGWRTFGNINVEHRQSNNGNKYIVASKRMQPFHSFAQKFNLEKEKLYTFSGIYIYVFFL